MAKVTAILYYGFAFRVVVFPLITMKQCDFTLVLQVRIKGVCLCRELLTSVAQYLVRLLRLIS